MPVRATKRGRGTDPAGPRRRRPDLRCVASPDSTVARELAGSGASVLIVDRYEIGEKQTSACAAPTEWLREPRARRRRSSRRSTGSSSTRPRSTYDVAAAVDVLDVRLPRRCAGCCSSRPTPSSTPRRSTDHARRGTHVVHTDRGDLRAPLVVDALGWRRVLGSRRQRPAARGVPVARPRGPPRRQRRRPRAVARPAVRPGRLRLVVPGRRRGARRRRLVRPALPRQGPDARARARRRRRPPCASRATGSRTSCARATDDGVFFAGDSAGPLPAGDRRGHPHRALLRPRARPRAARRRRRARARASEALARYAQFNDAHARTYLWLKRVQNLVGRVNRTPRDAARRARVRARAPDALGVRPLPRDRAAGVRARGQRAGPRRRGRWLGPPDRRGVRRRAGELAAGALLAVHVAPRRVADAQQADERRRPRAGRPRTPSAHPEAVEVERAADDRADRRGREQRRPRARPRC